MERRAAVERLADLVALVRRPHPVRVAIDGVDAAGKTPLADELVKPLEARGRTVIRASVDSFHRPRELHYRRGPDSPEGYYYDSFDHYAVTSDLLAPLGPGGDRRYRLARYDHLADAPVIEPVREAPEDAVLLFDGVFLLRSELRGSWDFTVFVQAGIEVTVERAVGRAAGSEWETAAQEAAFRERYRTRYLPGQRLYLDSVRPAVRADVVVENDDLARPRLRIRGERPEGTP